MRPHGQAVKTSPFHGGNPGSNPGGVTIIFFCGGVAQLARACGSYPQCQGFKSLLRYHFFIRLYLGAQLSWESICLTSRGSQVRALLCPPNMAWQFSWLECQHVTLEVVGSSPIQVANNYAGVAQLVEQLTCNQQVRGSSPPTSSNLLYVGYMEEFPSGQRGRTVNPLAALSVVRIHSPPPIEFC